ncbi:N-acetylmuramoyl-L-alanine amidase [Mergibacter septicus]|nr:N-acetylmuramoyl-L-alanine amidase [Mergibacter septicus]
MKKLLLSFFYLLILLLGCFMPTAFAATLNSIHLEQQDKSTEIHLSFSLPVKYSYFYLKNPDRLVIDIANSQMVKPLLPKQNANQQSSVEKVRISKSPKTTTLRIVVDLRKNVQVRFQHRNKNGGNPRDNIVIISVPDLALGKTNQSSKLTQITSINQAKKVSTPRYTKLVVTIDPGHGGKDPGAIGRVLHLKEKEVTLSIAKELKALLDKDPNFTAVLTRDRDEYISVQARSSIARQHKANFLISIHADSAPNSQAKGASVWVLSNRRANTETARWLEDQEKQSELLGGAGTVLSDHNEKYLDRTVLDLQFGHSQRVGYELGKSVLNSFGKIARLSHKTPQHASLGVLRAPDIPSILVETGFLSNKFEEKKLSSLAYRRQIAKAIYQGLVEYRKHNLNLFLIPDTQSSTSMYHQVKKGETMSAIARRYHLSLGQLQKLNPHIKNGYIQVGQKIKIAD